MWQIDTEDDFPIVMAPWTDAVAPTPLVRAAEPVVRAATTAAMLLVEFMLASGACILFLYLLAAFSLPDTPFVFWLIALALIGAQTMMTLSQVVLLIGDLTRHRVNLQHLCLTIGGGVGMAIAGCWLVSITALV